eukprot:1252514-Prorocentrum_lima.AAC.1
MCIRDSFKHVSKKDLERKGIYTIQGNDWWLAHLSGKPVTPAMTSSSTVSYTHLRAHETRRHL